MSDTITFAPNVTISSKTFRELSGQSLRVWMLICTMGAEKDKNIWIHQKTFAKEIGVCVSTIGRAIKKLVKLEYLLPQEEKHENRYKTYGLKSETPQVYDHPECGHPGTCSRDPSHDNPISHVVAGFPQKLLDQVAAIKASTRSESQRMTLITNMFLQFLPANAAHDEQPVVLLRDPPIVSPAIGTPMSDNIDDLRAQHQKVLREQKPGFGMAMHVINQRISVLEKQLKR